MNIYAHECNRSACAACISSECSAQHESGLEAEQYLRRMPCSASKELAKPARRLVWWWQSVAGHLYNCTSSMSVDSDCKQAVMVLRHANHGPPPCNLMSVDLEARDDRPLVE